MTQTPTIKKQSTTANKTVTVLLRCQRRANGAIIYHIANDKQQEYLVTLVNGVATGCSQMGEPCKGCARGRKCYHKTQCEAIEAARNKHIEKHGSAAGFIFRVTAPEKQVTASEPASNSTADEKAKLAAEIDAMILAEENAAPRIQAPGLVQRPRVEAPRKSAFEKEFKKLKQHREAPKRGNQGFQLFR